MNRNRLWLIPAAAAVILVTGISFVAKETAGVVLIIVGALGVFVGIGVAVDD